MGKWQFKKAISATCVGLTLALAGCGAREEPPDTRAADEAAIRKTDAEWVKAAQTKSVDAWLAFYTNDATVLPPNGPTATNRDSIRKIIAELMALPGLSINWRLSKVEVARSGDIAYAYGTYDMTFNDPKGKPVNDRGKILEIWKKQADGNWKCIVDTWNTDTPLPAP